MKKRIDLKRFTKVSIKRKSYGKFSKRPIYVDKGAPQWLLKGGGFKAGKHLMELLESAISKDFVLILTDEKTRVVNGKYVFVNFYDYDKLAQSNFLSVYRDSGLATATAFRKKLGLKDVGRLEKPITRSQAEELIQHIPQAVAKATKKTRDQFTEQVASILRQIDFKPDDIEHISAAGRQRYYRSALKKLEDKIKENFKKDNFKKRWENRFYKPWFRKNYWIFGTEYKRKLTRERISIDKLVDLRLETVDGYEEIIEIKPPNVEILKYDPSHKTFYPTEDLAKAITQSTYYIYEMELDELKLNLKAEDEGETSKVLKPRAKIVIGHTRMWRGVSKGERKKRKKALRLLNDSLVNIRLYLYDEIVDIGNIMIQKYKERLK